MRMYSGYLHHFEITKCMHRMAGAARETLQFSAFGQIHLKLSAIVATGDTGVRHIKVRGNCFGVKI